MLKSVLKVTGLPFNFCKTIRTYSATSFQFIDIENTNNGYSIVKMEKKPVNSLNLEMIQELIRTIDMLETEKDCRGMIITSKLPVFSAGLDILEMYQPKEKRLQTFWTSFQELKLRLFSSPMVVIAAVNGACPAGGCAIAFSADYRIIADGKHTMGLNETLLGLAAPNWLCQSLKLLVGHREAEKMLCLSDLCLPQQALEKGMVDKVVPQEDLMNASIQEIEKWLKIADIGRVATKMHMRKQFLEEFHQGREEDLNVFLKGMLNPHLQKLLGKYLEALKKSKI